MKAITLILFFSFIVLHVGARQITCSNNPARPAQYTSWVAAYNSCGNQTNDTIYLYGSSTSYGSIVLRKRLTIIGEGWGIASLYAHPATTFDAITLDSASSTQNGNRCYISGLVCPTIQANQGISNFTLDVVNGNNFYYAGNSNLSSQFFFNRCYFVTIRRTITGARFRCFVNNCIIKANTYYNNAFLGLSNSTINHCLITGVSAYGTPVFGECDNSTINNNIFLNLNNFAAAGGINNSNFSFNLFAHRDGVITIPSSLGSNTQSNNTNSGTSTSDFLRWSGFEFSIDDDYRLNVSSLGVNGASDGTNIGPEGGAYPFTYQLGAYPTVPSISEFTIRNARVSRGDQLRFSIKGVNKNSR
jgi:hypothetical protein